MTGKRFWMTMMLSMVFVPPFITGCGRDALPDVAFLECLDDLGAWRTEKVRRRIPEILESLGARIRNEQEPTRKMMLYAACTNTIVNLPLISTNTVEVPQRQRVGVMFHGIISSPYSMAAGALDNLAVNIWMKSEMAQFDLFCLRLEVWKRLARELERSDEMVDLWKMKLHPSDRKHLETGNFLKESSKRDIRSAMHNVEHELKRSYAEMFGEDAQNARMRFRAAIGREPAP